MSHSTFRRLNSYAGPLSPEQAAEGIKAASDNSCNLVADAALLLEHGRWARACSLSILAIEEAGKVMVLRHLVLLESPEEIRKVWRDYRSHTKKNVMGAILDCARGVIADGREHPHIEDMRSLFNPHADHPQLIDAVKQIGFYSDCLGNAHWSVPEDVIDEGLARIMFLTAKTLGGDGPMRTVEELRLWVKHVRPALSGDMLQLKQAVLDCYQEAHDRGVLQGKASVEDMVRFLL